MFPSIMCPSAGCSHRRVFSFLFHEQTEVEKGRFKGGQRGGWRTERTAEAARREESSVEVRSSSSSADVAPRSMDRCKARGG